MTKTMTVSGISILTVLSVLAFASTAFAATSVIHPADMQGWGFVSETGATGSGEMVSGPATPPLGSGSARLVTPAAGDGVILAKEGYKGTRLDEITDLAYSTYRTSGGAAQAIALQFNIDNDVTDADDAWKGRLVFEPYYTETVNTGAWQTWDPMTQGKWWGTGAAISATCSIGSPCTWAEVLSAFPNAGIHNVFGAVILKAGSGWAGFDGNADALTINSDAYDFEFDAPAPTDPVTKDDCKNGGWADFGFKNQGSCIQFVNTGKDSR